MRDGHTQPLVFVVVPGGVGARGGIGRLVTMTVRHWRAAQLQPALRVIDPYGRALSPLTALYLLRALAQIGWNARRHRIALVHIHMAARGSAVRKGLIIRLAARLGVPIVLHLHGSRMDEFHAGLPGWGRRLLRRTLASADRIVVPGEYWRRLLVDAVGIDAGVVHVVTNAVAGPPDVAPRRPESPCELLFLGRLSARKGLPELLQALAHADLAALPWRLRVAGDGDAPAFAERAAALGIAQRVEFLGWVPEERVPGLLARADVFVLPSHHEGLSMAMLEAMAHGCAVVTTPVGATLDAVADGTSALLVPAGDIERLAGALRRVIVEPALRAALQGAARRRWREGFDIDAHCRRLAALYREINRDVVAQPAPDPRASAWPANESTRGGDE